MEANKRREKWAEHEGVRQRWQGAGAGSGFQEGPSPGRAESSGPRGPALVSCYLDFHPGFSLPSPGTYSASSPDAPALEGKRGLPIFGTPIHYKLMNLER